MTRPADLRRLLLGFVGGRPVVMSPLAPADWRNLAAMAAGHRLEPILHVRSQAGTLPCQPPAAVAEQWRDAHRASGLAALAMRVETRATVALLESGGIRVAALKGAFTAWYGYPHAAQRPARDIDLLVPLEQALAAFDLLLANGYRPEEPGPRSPAASLHRDKHLPPLLTPSGIRVELHMRLWERSEVIGRVMPADASAALLARASRVGEDDPVRYLSAEDRLAHCIVHGVYSNRLDGGPLTLLDVTVLARHEAIDWVHFWRRAEREGWARGAALLFHLADRWCEPGLAAFARVPGAVDAELIEGAPELLLQDPSTRKTVGLIGTMALGARTGGLGGLTGTVRKRLGGDERSRAGEGKSAWTLRRLGETLREASRPGTIDVARRSTRLGRWLDAER